MMNQTVRVFCAAVAALVLALPLCGSNDGMEERGFSPEDGARLSVSAPELQGKRGGAEGGKFVQRLDRNGDGKVSASEFDGPPEHFRDFDQNGDGFITEDEAAKSPHPPRGSN